MIRKVIGIVGILLILLGFGLVVSGQFSVIGNIGDTCVSPKGYGSCTIELIKPAGTEINPGFSFDIKAEKVIDKEFSDEMQVSFFTEKQYTEYDKYGIEEYNFYLFRIPASWNDIGEFKIRTSSSMNRINAVPNSDTRVRLQHYGGVISIPYPYNFIQECTSQDVYLCENKDVLLIRQYVDAGYNRVREYNAPFKLLAESYGSYSTGIVSESLIGEATFTNIPNEQAVGFIRTEKDTSGLKPTEVIFPVPPETFISFKQLHYPTNVKFKIGNDLVVGRYTGKEEKTFYLPDLSIAIENYCKDTTGDCVIPLIIESDDASKFTIVSQLGSLRVLSTETNDEVELVKEKVDTKLYLYAGSFVFFGVVFLVLNRKKMFD